MKKAQSVEFWSEVTLGCVIFLDSGMYFFFVVRSESARRHQNL